MSYCVEKKLKWKEFFCALVFFFTPVTLGWFTDRSGIRGHSCVPWTGQTKLSAECQDITSWSVSWSLSGCFSSQIKRDGKIAVGSSRKMTCEKSSSWIGYKSEILGFIYPQDFIVYISVVVIGEKRSAWASINETSRFWKSRSLLSCHPTQNKKKLFLC